MEFGGRAVLVRGSVALLAGIAGAVLAQQPPDDLHVLNQIVVVGSNIPRPDTESALPVRVLTRGDILRSGTSTMPRTHGQGRRPSPTNRSHARLASIRCTPTRAAGPCMRG